METLTANMIKQSDVQGRLRLFRYGLVVITVVTFVLGIVYPWAALRSVGISQPVTSHLQFALVATIVVAIVMVIIYFVYAEILKRTVGQGSASK